MESFELWMFWIGALLFVWGVFVGVVAVSLLGALREDDHPAKGDE